MKRLISTVALALLAASHTAFAVTDDPNDVYLMGGLALAQVKVCGLQKEATALRQAVVDYYVAHPKIPASKLRAAIRRFDQFAADEVDRRAAYHPDADSCAQAAEHAQLLTTTIDGFTLAR